VHQKQGNLFAGFRGREREVPGPIFKAHSSIHLIFLFCLTSVVSRRTRRLFVTLLTDVSRRSPQLRHYHRSFFQTTA
jgi:hypothetical protein